MAISANQRECASPTKMAYGTSDDCSCRIVQYGHLDSPNPASKKATVAGLRRRRHFSIVDLDARELLETAADCGQHFTVPAAVCQPKHGMQPCKWGTLKLILTLSDDRRHSFSVESTLHSDEQTTAPSQDYDRI